MSNIQRVLRFLSLGLMVSFVLVLLAACRGEDEVITYTVTFDSMGGSAIESHVIQNGRRVDRPADPMNDDGSEFIGWYKDSQRSVLWNFEIDIVTDDVTLYAQWRLVEPFPTEVSMTPTAFSNTVTWIQTDVSGSTEFELMFYQGTRGTDAFGRVFYTYTDPGFIVSGTHTVVNDTTVEWTPSVIVQGGVYKVTILTDGADEVEVADLPFKGLGSQENPYLIFSAIDLASMVNQDHVGAGLYYVLQDNIHYESAYALMQNNHFHGTLQGNGFEITLSGNAGLFFGLSETAIVENLVVYGTLLTGTTPLIGGIAHENRGIIRDVVSWVTITSTAGEVGDPETKMQGGVGGLVGINHEGATIENCRYRSSGSSVGVLKANIGAGGIASINYGTITRCENRGALGAFNAVESGRSLSRYSYMGGIAGFNYGLIEQSNTTSVGKLLAQRYWNVTPPEGTANNRVIGGIVGYNGADGVIRESYFNGIRVHGDQYVGGIAGINAGLITHSYVVARYYDALSGRSYVGGRINVGGIAGALEGAGRIEYSYAAINVYAYEDTPNALAIEAFNSVAIETNHDPRALGAQEYGNVFTDTLAAPSGSGNTIVNNSTLTAGDGIMYALPASFAAILGEPFVDSDEGIILRWELE